MMATEVQSGDLSNGSSSRLEVSIDGLTLSPDPEGEQEQVVEPDPEPSKKETEDHVTAEGTDDGAEGDSAKTTIEKKWGFGLLELYGLALKFFKDKDGKAFHPTYEEKLRLVALHKQVLLGPYNLDASPEVGFFDVLGNDRRVAGRFLRVRSSVTREELRVEPLLLHILGRCLPGNVFRSRPTGRRPRGRPRTRCRDYVSRLAWERLGVPPEELEEVSREREVWASLLRLLPPRPGPG
uniref:Uncharacterized protein n=1 Tax=Esox lucius TaxID=8010 RepID=A0AAY5L8N4_ESOLU